MQPRTGEFSAMSAALTVTIWLTPPGPVTVTLAVVLCVLATTTVKSKIDQTELLETVGQ